MEDEKKMTFEAIVEPEEQAAAQPAADESDITDMIDIVYHSRNNSFAVKEGVAYYCDVDIDMLEDRLDELGVGYGWF